MHKKFVLHVVSAALGFGAPFCMFGQTDWPVFGHGPGGLRYSPLKQINVQNVSGLQRAWVFHSGAPGSEATPLVVGGVMYVTAPNGIYALNPENGKVIWRFRATGVGRRGLSYWPGDKDAHPRVLAGVGSRMVAIDVTTGKPAPQFGNDGFVNLRQGVSRDFPHAPMAMQSPPAIYKNIVITGSNNNELAPSLGAYGDIRGWDARSGKLLWSFHTVPRKGELGNDTWADDGWKDRSGTNCWGFMTVDEKRGIVFVPLGAPTSDFYGADRHGNGLFGDSLVALNAATGKLVWYQQIVHHDIWDYDLTAAPALIEIDRNGKRIPAVAEITKMGLLFIFNRITGAPIFGMVERPVPQSTVPGEATSATQPFPLKPPPLGLMNFKKKDLYNVTPTQAAFCQDLWNRNHLFTKGPYTPMPVSGNGLTFPSTIGGTNWGGVSVDPKLGYLFVNLMNLAQWGHMEKRRDPKTGAPTYWRTSEMGTYARFWNPKTHIPCQNPPFGQLIAVNINTGDIAWRVPLGTVEELAAKGIKNTGSVNLGGSIATAGGLVFIGATNDDRFRAFDAKTGKQLWVHKIPADGHSIPMTYLAKNKKQYVVIMAGGNSRFGNVLNDSLVAFTLSNGFTNGHAALVGTSSTVAQRSSASRGAYQVQPERSALPAGRGKAVVQQICGECHSVGLVASERHDRAGWSSVVQTMEGRGAHGTKEQIKQVIDYLTTNFALASKQQARGTAK